METKRVSAFTLANAITLGDSCSISESRNRGEAEKGIKVLDTRKLPNGVYFFELVQDNEKIKGGKFIVQH